MTSTPSCIFLDTNVYIIGTADQKSPEAQILDWVGYGEGVSSSVEVVVSDELFDQILRVAKRLRDKDWGGQILGRIWKKLRLRYVLLDEKAFVDIEASGEIPREDIGVFLTARGGEAECFISSNHELIRSLVNLTSEFECVTPSQFVSKYLME